VGNLKAELKENDAIETLVEDGRYVPFLDRTEDDLLSLTVKYLVNFAAAIIQIINYPVLIFGLLLFVETGIKWFNDPEFTFGSKLDWLIYLIGGNLLLKQLYQHTNSNIITPHIDLIWALNFKGRLNNRFQSLALKEKRSIDLEELVITNAEKYAKIREKELLEIIQSHELTIKQIISEFPDDILQSFIRVSGFLPGVIKDKTNPRFQFEVMMDRLLGEISSLSVFNGLVHQGSIMLLETNHTLKIVGQYNLHDNVVEQRKIKLGDKFAGKVVKNGKSLWIEDIYKEDAFQYGFGPSIEKKSYKGILGVPIRRKGYESYTPIGIINLHFKTSPIFYEEQRTVIQNILEVYTQFIVTLLDIEKQLKTHETDAQQIKELTENKNVELVKARRRRKIKTFPKSISVRVNRKMRKRD
jgi:hypothetical protein